MASKAQPEFVCPLCESRSLSPSSGPSILDGECKWQCDACRKQLGTKRPTVMLLAFMAVCLIAAIGSWAVAYAIVFLAPLPAPGAPPDELSTVLKASVLGLVGMVMGPVALIIVGRDLLAPRPKRVSK